MKRLKSILKSFRWEDDTECRRAQELMSSFIDSMASTAEVDRLEAHLDACGPCQRQLQAYISVRNLMRCADEPEVPQDLVLETRVRLSHARNPSRLSGMETRLGNLLRPIAIPAVAGICSTVLFFGVLLGSLSTPAVIASDDVPDAPVSLYKRVRTTDPTMTRFADTGRNLAEPLTVETRVSERGRVIDYQILSGPDDPEVNRWLRELLYFAEFSPATVFGRPVTSRVILSFIGVTS